MERIFSHPFLSGLSDGTLPEDKFMNYLWQDSFYLKEYGKTMALAASRFDDPRHMAMFLRFATENLEAERLLHEEYLHGLGCPVEVSQTCLLCSAHLYRQVAAASLETAVAAVLPCFYVYSEVGQYLSSRSRLAGNPYRKWLEAYSDDGFRSSTEAIAALCDSLAGEEENHSWRLMTEAFVTGVRLEWLFWDSAYRMEQWNI